MQTFNPYYRFEIDTTGQKIDFDVNMVSITNGGGNSLSSQELNHGVRFAGQQYLQPGTTNIITSQLDYIYPFSKAFKVKVGAKYSDARLDNDLQALLLLFVLKLLVKLSYYFVHVQHSSTFFPRWHP